VPPTALPVGAELKRDRRCLSADTRWDCRIEGVVLSGPWPPLGSPGPPLSQRRGTKSPRSQRAVAVTEREITGVIWHEEGEHLYVLYAANEPEHLVGTREVASAFAEDVGLMLEERAEGSLRWCRRPQAP
jgi:hypothetical protein